MNNETNNQFLNIICLPANRRANQVERYQGDVKKQPSHQASNFT